ncbi:hypothetical protein V6N13_053699 [Hibiscus sabdariffa]
MKGITLEQFPILDRLGSPFQDKDLQLNKNGKVDQVLSDFVVDGGMEVDVSQENNMTNYSGGIGNGMIVEASVSHVSKSYAWVVSGTTTTVMSDQPPSLDDVVVE